MNHFTMATYLLICIRTLNDSQCRTLLFLFRFIPPLFYFILHTFRYLHEIHGKFIRFIPAPFVSTCRLHEGIDYDDSRSNI